jgi:hypothetical protein
MLINSEYENLLKELHDKEKYNQAIDKRLKGTTFYH